MSYIFAGEQEMDISLALEKLNTLFGIKKLLLEGGSIINGASHQADVVDELSLVVAPIIGDANGKPLFYDGDMKNYCLKNATVLSEQVLWLQYIRS